MGHLGRVRGKVAKIEKWYLNSGNSAHSYQQNFQKVLMGQASKGFSAKSTGGRLGWRVEGLYKEGITIKMGHAIWEGRKKEEHTIYK